MSPQLLLVALVALMAATLTGLVTRRHFLFLPLFWAISICALLIGQEVGRIAHVGLLAIGEVEIGVGLAVNAAAIVGLRIFTLWYNQGRG